MNPLVVPIVETVGNIADDLFTSDEERARAQIDSDKIGLEAARIDADLIKGQQDINKEEAKHSSRFVAGWRPALGWVCVCGMAYQYMLYPLLVWMWVWAQAQGWVPDSLKPPPLLDINALLVLLGGILGLATNRTFEKVKGVAR